MKVSGLAVLMAVGAAGLAGCNSAEKTASSAPESVQARVVESRQEQVPSLLRATGTLHARETATLSAQVMGRVRSVLVHEGDSVRAGQVLVVLDDSTLKASADQAEAAAQAAESQRTAALKNADLAASTLARYQKLQAQKSVSPQEMDEVSRRAEAASAQVDALGAHASAMRAQVASAKAMLGYTRIVAPFAGVITSRMADPGAMAAPGVPLMQIDSAGPLQLQAAIPESALAQVREGMKIPVTLDGLPDEDPAGRVAQIVPAADPGSHSFQLKIDLPQSKALRAGMYGTAEIPTGMRQAIVVPRSAIVMRGSLPCAYAIDANGVAQLRYVTLGATRGNSVEVLSGIAAGEKLVDAPADGDFAGKRIEVQP